MKCLLNNSERKGPTESRNQGKFAGCGEMYNRPNVMIIKQIRTNEKGMNRSNFEQENGEKECEYLCK